MAFLGALTALGGGLEEAEKTNIAAQTAQFNQLYKEQMIQLREQQLANAHEAQMRALSMANLKRDAQGPDVTFPLEGFPVESDPNASPNDTGYVPPVPPDQSYAPQMPPGGAAGLAGGPPPQPAPGQPPGQMPPQGPPQGQVAQMGNVQQPGAVQPTQPPRPDGGPSFGQPLAQQGMVQVPQMQAQQPPPGRGAAYASLQDPTQVPTPGQERAKARQGVIAQAGVPETGRPPTQQVAQAGQPQQPPPTQPQQPPPAQQPQRDPRIYKRGDPINIHNLMSSIKTLHPEFTEQQTAKFYKAWLPKVEAMEKLRDAEQERVYKHAASEALTAEKKRKEEEEKAPSLTGPALDAAAEHYYKTGDYGGSLGYGKKAQANRQAIGQRAVELHPDDPVANWPAEQQAFKTRATGLRVLQQRGANLRLVAAEAKRFTKRIQPFLEGGKVSPTDYPDVNKLIQIGREKTGDPNIVQFGIALDSLASIYARILKPTGVLTEGDMQRGVARVQKYWSEGQLKAAVKQMNIELKAAEEGLADAEAQYGIQYGAPEDDVKEEVGKPEPEQLPANVIQGLEEGKPHRIKTPRGEEMWQLENGNPVKVK